MSWSWLVAFGSDSWFAFWSPSNNANCDCICLLFDINSRRCCFSCFSCCFSSCWASSLAWQQDDWRMHLPTSADVADRPWIISCVADPQSTDSLICSLELLFEDWVLALMRGRLALSESTWDLAYSVWEGFPKEMWSAPLAYGWVVYRCIEHAFPQTVTLH